MANLKDVARLADVDASTVSRVLRGDPVQATRLETRDRIFAAAKELRYRPNALGRSLRTRRTDTFGLVIPSLENVGFSEVTHGIQAAAAAAGQLVVVVEADALEKAGDENDREELYSRLITDGRVDGLIVAFATLDDQLVTKLADRGIPLVLVNRRTAGIHGSVVVADERGGRLAVQHLVDLGHRKIGYVGLAAETDTARRREQGYLSAMADAGVKVQRGWVVDGAPTLAGGRGAAKALLSRDGSRPTALFVASLLGAIGVLTELRAARVAIPYDISVIAFNDHELAAHLDPPLTTVRMPNFRMGTEAVRLLLDAIDGQPRSDVVIEDSPEVVIRASTTPPSTA